MFAKIFASIYDSSIADDWKLRLVFQDMLVLADKDGVVDMTPQAISRRTNVPLDIVLDGIALLEGEDHESRTPDENGRRLLRLDPHREWGWKIVNYLKYRESATKEMLRMGDADRKRAYRAKFHKTVPPVPPPTVQSTVQEEEAEQSRTSGRHVPDIDTKGLKTQAEEVYQIYPNKVGKPRALNSILKAIQQDGFEKVKTATENFARAWTNAPSKEFCPHPSTWFNQERYNDDPSTWTKTSTTAKTPFNLKTIIDAKEEAAAQLKFKGFSSDRWTNKEAYEAYIKIIKEIRVLKDDLSRLA